MVGHGVVLMMLISPMIMEMTLAVVAMLVVLRANDVGDASDSGMFLVLMCSIAVTCISVTHQPVNFETFRL